MAAIRTGASGSLRALTAAALALPGLAPGRAQGAEDDEFAFQYGRYTEGERDLSGVDSAYDPIRADNLMASARFSLVDRWSLAFMYEQDTWSGATPITTAPLVMGGNQPTSPDGVSGATPFIEGDLFLDGSFDPLRIDELGELGDADPSLVHTLSSASPETRQQIGATLGYAFEPEELPLELSLGGGVSLEDDYDSAFGELGGAFQFDQGRFRLEAAASYTHNETNALLDPDAVPYIDTSAYDDDVETFLSTGNRKLSGESDEVGLRLALSRILNRNTLVEASFGYSHASGFLENPYKVVEIAFIDPAQQSQAPPGGYYAQVHALLEQRPNSRNQWSADARLVQYVAPLDAALHLSYGFYADDWGIDAHTFEASWGQPIGWGLTVTPRVRFYSQSQADFYEPYLISEQAYRTIVTDPDTGDILSITPFDPSLLPSHFSSDARLSGFGALTGGVSLSARFMQGVVLDGGFEYYAHRGDWQLGGGGEGDYADFDYYLLSAGLRFDTSALGAFEDADDATGEDHAAVHAHTGEAPAGVMLAHMLGAPGDWMFGVRYGYSRQDGDVLRGTRSADDAEIAARGCEDVPCLTAPKTMTMQMIMVDLSWAPTSWLNLMLMPSFVVMEMDVRPLDGAEPDVHGTHDHQTGGVGDTSVQALFELFETQGHEIHAGLGLSAPSGSVDEKNDRSHQEERGYTHYGMQLGSGTWDFLPSLTYTGAWRRLSFGGQLSSTVRLEEENDSGYALGDVFQATGWAGFAMTRWLSATVRGLYTWQGQIRHEYDRRHDESGPMDFPSNYGGQYVDIGLGVAAAATSGALAGQRLALEWLQPLHEDVDGYQLERVGTLQASWSLAF